MTLNSDSPLVTPRRGALAAILILSLVRWFDAQQPVSAQSKPAAATTRVADSAKPKTKPAKASANATLTYGNADSITEAEVKIYDYFLASDQLEGRNLPSRRYDVAALYVASHLAEWGLKPGGSTEKTDGPLQPYFVPMELVSKTVVPEESKITITAPPGAGGRGGATGASGGTGGGGRGGGRGGGGAATPGSPQTTDFEIRQGVDDDGRWSGRNTAAACRNQWKTCCGVCRKYGIRGQRLCGHERECEPL